MKTAAVLMALALSLTACGAANTDPAGNTGNSADLGGGEGFGDDHGKSTPVGEREMGQGYRVRLFVVDSPIQSEGVYELSVEKDGKPQSDASVTIWLGDPEGKELSPIAACEWMDSSQVFDCHVLIPPEPQDDMRVWIRVRHGDFDERTEFDYAPAN
ncbi:MAG: hypothetical protein K8I27_10520 [Planctomycetes bacterium]|nr:hypothetical protein [Planctomycetota bacterium]